MSSELMSLTWVTALTAVLWMPYILNLIAVRGLVVAVGYPENPKPLSGWATKMKAGHANAIENLVVFATLVLIANAAGLTEEARALEREMVREAIAKAALDQVTDPETETNSQEQQAEPKPDPVAEGFTTDDFRFAFLAELETIKTEMENRTGKLIIPAK